MAFDSLTLYVLVREWGERLRGARLRDVVQPEATEVVLRFRGEGDFYLLLSAHPVRARAHRLERFPQSKERTPFAQTLLKHLLRSELLSVEQKGLDRILVFRFSSPPEMFEMGGERLLIAELMGKHSNIILVHGETQRILEAIKHVDASRNRYREILPGSLYFPPPPTRRADPFSLSRDDFEALVAVDSEIPLWKRLLDGVEGLSPAFARYLVAWAPNESPRALWETFRTFMERIRDGKVSPTVRYEGSYPDAKPLDFALFPPVGESCGHGVAYATVNDAVTAYYDRLMAYERFLLLRAQIAGVLDRREGAVLRKLEAHRHELRLAEEAERYRRHGELLMAFLSEIPPRAASVRLRDLFEPDAPEVEIPLSPTKSPLENARAFFKQYQKAKRGVAIIRRHIEEEEDLLVRIGVLRERLGAAKNFAALNALREELVQEGWIADVARPRRREKNPLSYRLFTTSGWEILVGRNERENELLVTRIARKDDVWLHAKEIPGSHVLIRNPERKTQIPMPVLLEAARLAAYFSKGRHSKRVLVDYTFAKYVVRPKGTAAGFVTYTHEKTLFVEPGLLED